MDTKFAHINKEYDLYYNELFSKGKLLRETSKGYYGSISADSVFGFFKKMGLGKFRSFVDLGSGDGKIVLIAGLFTKAVGIEIDDELVKAGEKIRKKLRLKDAEFIKADFFDADLSKYNVLFINPDKPIYDIEKKLRKEMAKSARLVVCGELYRPLNMKLEKSLIVEGTFFGVYINT